MTKKNSKKKLILLDAHAIIHRAYHALPQFSTSDGVPTGGLYGIISMLFSIIKDLDPDYIVACYDLPKPTHRHLAFKDYKAGRKKSDPELVSQIIASREIFTAFGIPIYDCEGFEADDLLGTIAEQVKDDKNIETIIASGDMDTLQLVRGNSVKVYTLRKGLKDIVLYNEKKVIERFSFKPKQLIDFKGLRGDPSDNIPGVAGIGEKSATDLIIKFKDINGVFKAVEKGEEYMKENGFTKRVFNALNENKEEAEFSKVLATIHCEAPIKFELPKKEWKQNLMIQDIHDVFNKFEFRNFEGRLREALDQPLNVEEEEVKNNIDEDLKRELELLLWVVDSNYTNPDLEEVYRYTKTKDPISAREFLIKSLMVQKTLNIFEDIEKPLLPVVDKMKKIGIELDVKFLDKMSKKIHKELVILENEIYKLAGREFNIKSPKQLGEILYDELNLSVKSGGKTAGGARSTKEEVLQKMDDQHEIIKPLLEYRELQKLTSTYIDALPKLVEKDGRLHPTLLQHGTTTGRMSSINPNIQNIPVKTERGKEIRSAFVAKKGYKLVACDYSQIEIRIAAMISKDKKFIDIFKNGEDIHNSVASYVFNVPQDDVTKEMRRKAKVINFGVLYGMGVVALQKNLGVPRAEAKEFYDNYFDTFKELTEYLDKVKSEVNRNGYTETMWGRRRYFKGIKSPIPHIRAQAERMAINAPIQGTSADVTKLAMIEIDKYIEENKLSKDVSMLLQIHDELIFEVKENIDDKVIVDIVNIMQSIIPENETCGIPLLVKAEVGPDWGNLKVQ